MERKLGLGGTGIAYGALASGEIDIYPEYTGTISRAILKDASVTTIDALRSRLRPLGLTISDPLGFANTYALAVARATATRLGLRTISDLARHPGLTAAFDPGFIDRDDGWRGLRRHYGLPLTRVTGMEHALTYQAVASGHVDVIDVFSTDGQLARYDLVVLEDDRHFFPQYAAVLLARASLPERLPRTWSALRERLAGRIDRLTMVRLNADVEVEHRTFAQTAATFLGDRDAGQPARRHDLIRDVGRLTLEHLALVAVSLAVAVAIGLPLGLVAARHRVVGQVELMSVGVLQTIPALALLAFMIPLFGIGKLPALVALSLYALLPIVRNTYAGVTSLDRQLVDMAAVMQLGRWQRLAWIELPLASRRTRPLALMKLTSSRIRPAAATPADTGASAATPGRLSATARRQKAWTRRFRRGGSASSTARMVRPEKIVSSTTAIESASAMRASCDASVAEPASA